MFTNYICDDCGAPVYKELGHWWHRWKDDEETCPVGAHVENPKLREDIR